jgi:hypothetical protein
MAAAMDARVMERLQRKLDSIDFGEGETARQRRRSYEELLANLSLQEDVTGFLINLERSFRDLDLDMQQQQRALSPVRDRTAARSNTTDAGTKDAQRAAAMAAFNSISRGSQSIPVFYFDAALSQLNCTGARLEAARNAATGAGILAAFGTLSAQPFAEWYASWALSSRNAQQQSQTNAQAPLPQPPANSHAPFVFGASSKLGNGSFQPPAAPAQPALWPYGPAASSTADTTAGAAAEAAAEAQQPPAARRVVRARRRAPAAPARATAEVAKQQPSSSSSNSNSSSQQQQPAAPASDGTADMDSEDSRDSEESMLCSPSPPQQKIAPQPFAAAPVPVPAPAASAPVPVPAAAPAFDYKVGSSQPPTAQLFTGAPAPAAVARFVFGVRAPAPPVFVFGAFAPAAAAVVTSTAPVAAVQPAFTFSAAKSTSSSSSSTAPAAAPPLFTFGAHKTQQPVAAAAAAAAAPALFTFGAQTAQQQQQSAAPTATPPPQKTIAELAGAFSLGHCNTAKQAQRRRQQQRGKQQRASPAAAAAAAAGGAARTVNHTTSPFKQQAHSPPRKQQHRSPPGSGSGASSGVQLSPGTRTFNTAFAQRCSMRSINGLMGPAAAAAAAAAGDSSDGAVDMDFATAAGDADSSSASDAVAAMREAWQKQREEEGLRRENERIEAERCARLAVSALIVCLVP